jgi:Uma2 family endonuclease
MTDAVQTNLLTADEFWDLYGGKEEFADGFRLHYELINGKIKDVPMPGGDHSELQLFLGSLIRAFIYAHGLGKAYTELHCKLSADTTLVPDIAFVSTAQLAFYQDTGKPLPFAPDLAVEIISPSNSSEDMQEKLDLYLAAGTQEVWMIYPRQPEVTVHRANGTWQTIKRDGLLSSGDLLPGLSIQLADLFPPSATAGGES